jgi:hypothetical protein
MIGREYFARQAMTLLRMAKATKDPDLSAKVLSKAADLEAKASEIPGGPPVVTPAIKDQTEY